MSRPRPTGPLFVLIAIAAIAWLAASRLPTLVHEYQQARELSPTWGYAYLAILATAALSTALLAGWALWLLIGAGRAKVARRARHSRPVGQMSPSDRTAETELHLADVGRLADDSTLPVEVRASLRQSLDELSAKRAGAKLEIVAFGTISSGKSSLLNALAGRDVFRSDAAGGTTITRSELAWPGADHVVLVDTPGLAEVKGIDREIPARQAARDADLVLFVVDGPLKHFEFTLLRELVAMEKRVILCLNKEDWYTDADRRRLVDQLHEQAGSLIPPADVLSVRATPVVRTRVRVLPDGREIEETVTDDSDISTLAERMLETVGRDGSDLLAANLLLRARGLAADARGRIASSLDRQAEEVVQRAMWQAAAAAALSPLPVVDVAAGLAVTTGMVVSLARVYRQAIDLETVSRLVAELGKNLVAILGSSAAAPAVGSAVASVLKTAPGIGTLAGGALQGLVQALVTRWIGRVFMVYFRGEMHEPALGWTALAREQWNAVTRPKELAQLVKTGLARLGWRPPMTTSDSLGSESLNADLNYAAALTSVHHAIQQFDGCTAEEKEALHRELRELESMATKLQSGRIEIVLFGEIDTGKSALINALVGQSIAQVDVRGGWTRDVWHVAWQGSGYCLPGLADSQVVLIDTPGINEVEGAQRGEMARDAAARADLILFVTDSDLNQLEYSALLELAGSHKPILLVFNKTDNYTPDARRTLLATFASRLHGVVAADDVVETTADPLPREYVIEAADGRERSEYRRPAPNVEALKERILEILARDGKAIVALNGALYAADKSDRIATIKLRMRNERATATIWSYAAMKAVAVAITPVPALDVLGGSAVDVTMVVTLAHVYGIPLTWVNARQLIESIVKAAGWVMVMEAATHLAANLFVGLTLGTGKILTALPQGAAAGYGSFIVGQAAKYYFEHGASWGGEAPKTVVTRILAATDKQSVLERLQAEIRRKLAGNRHSGQKA